MTPLPMWIEERGGLRFACTQCGDCCRGEGGYVWVEAHEIERLARAVDLPFDAFARRYVRRVGGELALVDRPGTRGDCVFWEDGRGCVVYADRPDQCRTFPFWPEHIESPRAWKALARECPGVRTAQKDVTARLYPVEEIRAILDGAGETDVGGAASSPAGEGEPT